MSLTVVLDTGPLGRITNPKITSENDTMAAWLQDRLRHGTRVIIPEIANYELRREVLLANKIRGLRELGGSTTPGLSHRSPTRTGR